MKTRASTDAQQGLRGFQVSMKVTRTFGRGCCRFGWPLGDRGRRRAAARADSARLQPRAFSRRKERSGSSPVCEVRHPTRFHEIQKASKFVSVWQLRTFVWEVFQNG